MLEAKLVDEMHLAVSPVLLGGLDLPALGYGKVELSATPAAAHYVVTRKG